MIINPDYKWRFVLFFKYSNSKPLLFLLFSFCFISNPITSFADQKDTMINIKDVLIKEHGWEKVLLGPIGQTYTISIDSNNQPIIAVHPMIEAKVKRQKSTRICSIFTKGRKLMFDADVALGYSETSAIKARKRFMLEGETAITDADWLQIDKYSWLSYINEGIYAGKKCFPNKPCGHIESKFYDVPFTIKECRPTEVVLKRNGENIVSNKEYVFPNLILTLPEYIRVSPSKTSEKSPNENITELMNEYNEMALKAGQQIAPCMELLFERDDFSNFNKNDFIKNLYGGKIQPEHIIMVGTICKRLGTETGAELLFQAFQYGDMDAYFKEILEMLSQ